MAQHCIYFGDPLQSQVVEGEQVHACLRHGQCIRINRNTGTIPSCDTCRDAIALDSPELASRWVDPLTILDRGGTRTTALRGLLGGRAVFLFCGGPSANDLPLEQLSRRGAWVFAVNNAAGHKRVRPQAFICADPPSKFSHCIWQDPAIMKFVPTVKMHGGHKATIRRKVCEAFEPMGKVREMPNVWGFARRAWFKPDDSFFVHEEASWGNHDSGVTRTGEEKTVCTMLLAMRLLRHLGAARVYMLGVDFNMAAGYSFPQGRTEAAIKSNNDQFAVVNRWLCRMSQASIFERFGIQFFNVNARSGLRAFSYVPFAEALEDTCRGIESVPDLSGWYEK